MASDDRHCTGGIELLDARSDAPVASHPRIVLKNGDQGPDVARLVWLLQHLGFWLKSTDVFDPVVKRTVEAFQVCNVDAAGQPLVIDGTVGPSTSFALEAAAKMRHLEARTMLYPPEVPEGGSEIGRRALAIALREVEAASGEEGADNCGADIRRFLDAAGPEGTSWAAAFVSYCFKEAIGGEPVFGFETLAHVIHAQMRKLGHAYGASMSNLPQPGDIIVWRRADPSRGSDAIWRGHAGIVHSFADGVLWTVEGNRGPFPSKVSIYRYSWARLVTSASDERFKPLYGLSRYP